MIGKRLYEDRILFKNRLNRSLHSQNIERNVMVNYSLRSFAIHPIGRLSVLLLLLNCSSQSPSDYSSDFRVVDKYGQLRVEGNKIVSMQGDTVVLEGMSLFWSQWIDTYYNYDCIRWLRDDWHCEVIRAAVGTAHGGYLDNPETEMKKICKVIEACIDLGIYVIVDWHSHKAESEQEESIDFFSEIACLYGDKPNVIYEIYNEPLRVSWDKVVKPYHEAVIASIRNYDPDNIIIVGTTHWSQNIDEAADNPIPDENVAYSLHFYAGTHKQWLRDKALCALDKNIALWVTECGTCNSDGNGPIDHTEFELWYDFMRTHKISWCNWSVSDKLETSAALLPDAEPEGGWSESELSESGKLVRSKIREANL